MSQIYKSIAGGGGGGGTTLFTEDTGTAAPVAGNINVLGGSGIDTSGSGDTITISIQNSTTDTGQTIGLQTIALSTIDCSAVGTYFFTTQLAAFESTGPASAGGQLYTTVISDGVTATVVDDTDSIAHESASLANIDYQMSTSGTNALVNVTGVAGLTINWGAITIHVYRG